MSRLENFLNVLSRPEDFLYIIAFLCFLPAGWLIRRFFTFKEVKYKWWYFVIAGIGFLIGSLLLDREN